MLLVCGKGADTELAASTDCLGHLQKHPFFSKGCHHAVLKGYQPLTVSGGDHGDVSQACLPFRKTFHFTFIFPPFILSDLVLLMSLLLQQISRGGIDNFVFLLCPGAFSVLFDIFFSSLDLQGAGIL